MSATQDPSSGQGQGKRPLLTDEQKQAILRAASQIVAAAVDGDQPQLSDPTLAGAAQQPVFGCFVTLKRQGRLRGCCGSLGREMTLSSALSESAVASAVRDLRMPSVSPTELEHLDLTVSFLYDFQVMTAKGPERAAHVQIGRHGLQIIRGATRGLLLPSVATEHHLGAEAFLRQVCLKAGLPPTAWKDDDVRLITFQAEAFGGPFDRSVLLDRQGLHRELFSEGQIDQLARACRDNLLALLQGATPTYYLPNCPDATVQGITITLDVPGQEELTRLSQLSLRPGLPLQSALLDLAKMGSRGLLAARIDDVALDSIKLDLTVLYDPAMHGTVAKPDLEGIDPARRAVVVFDNDRSATVFDPNQTAEQLLERAAREAQVRIPDQASVISLRAISTSTPVIVAAVPRPQTGKDERPPAVAGMFYPSDASELSKMVDDLLAEPEPPRRHWPGALVPHAGLKYSGRLAAAVLQRIEIPETVIIVAPKHTRLGVDWAVAPHQTWALPGRTVESDPQLARQLAETIPDLQLDAAAHAKEHSIEVQLPLLARLAPQSRVVGIVVGAGNVDRCHEFAEGLADVLRGREDRTLLLISSDMNHYANEVETRRVDQLALDSLLRLDPKDLFETVCENRISMCGVLPSVIVLDTLRELGRLDQCELVGHTTSAEASGDTGRVVGYAGLLFG